MAKKKTDGEILDDLLLNTDRNVLIHGKGGTGKTYHIKKYIEKAEEEGKVVLVCAPTGTAAVNVGGETAHSLFGIPVPSYGVPISKTPPSKIKILASADAVVIDEISMMRNDNFSYAMRVLKKAEKAKGKKIRVILSGDFSQLPPVVQKNEMAHLKKCGYDESGYPFTTKEWAGLHLKVAELTTIHRQEDGSEFAENLAKVRDCDDSCIPYFWQFVKEGYEASDGEVRLCGTNAEADNINKDYIDSLPGNKIIFTADKKGRGTMGIADEVVILKEGARVMFTVNDVVKGKYQNGTLGTIVRLKEEEYAIVVDDDGNEIYVGKHEYKTYSYKITGGVLTKNQIGSIKQIPLKIAAAITIHKSQGKTLDKVVLTPNVFASGQLYVALSRVKSEQGLILTKEIEPEHLKPNPIVDEFYKNGFTYEVKAKPKVKKSSTTKTTAKKSAVTKKKTSTKKTTSSKKSTSTKSTTKKSTKSTVKKPAKSTSKKTTVSKVGKPKKTAGKTTKKTAVKSIKNTNTVKKSTKSKLTTKK